MARALSSSIGSASALSRIERASATRSRRSRTEAKFSKAGEIVGSLVDGGSIRRLSSLEIGERIESHPERELPAGKRRLARDERSQQIPRRGERPGSAIRLGEIEDGFVVRHVLFRERSKELDRAFAPAEGEKRRPKVVRGALVRGRERVRGTERLLRFGESVRAIGKFSEGHRDLEARRLRAKGALKALPRFVDPSLGFRALRERQIGVSVIADSPRELSDIRASPGSHPLPPPRRGP